MKIHATRLGITICLILMSAVPTFSQTLEANPETSAPATVAEYGITDMIVVPK